MPELTDRSALLRQRTRARAAPDLALHRAVAGDIQERLKDVNRDFTSVAVITPWPEIWSGFDPSPELLRDDDTLDIKAGAYDLVIHSLCLHWANDPLGQLIQCRRALKPDGLLIATLLGGESLGELRDALAMAEADVSGGLSPRVLPMGEIRDLGGLMHRAGFAMPVADSDRIRRSYSNLRDLMHTLRAMGEGNALAERLRTPTRRALFDRAEEILRGASPSAGIDISVEIITLTGWAPDPTQPQPLKPGSASHSLDQILRELQED